MSADYMVSDARRAVEQLLLAADELLSDSDVPKDLQTRALRLKSFNQTWVAAAHRDSSRSVAVKYLHDMTDGILGAIVARSNRTPTERLAAYRIATVMQWVDPTAFLVDSRFSPSPAPDGNVAKVAETSLERDPQPPKKRLSPKHERLSPPAVDPTSIERAAPLRPRPPYALPGTIGGDFYASMKRLSERDQDLLAEAYGVSAAAVTQAALGEKHNLSHTRVGQIFHRHSRHLAKTRAPLLRTIVSCIDVLMACSSRPPKLDDLASLPYFSAVIDLRSLLTFLFYRLPRSATQFHIADIEEISYVLPCDRWQWEDLVRSAKAIGFKYPANAIDDAIAATLDNEPGLEILAAPLVAIAHQACARRRRPADYRTPQPGSVLSP